MKLFLLLIIIISTSFSFARETDCSFVNGKPKVEDFFLSIENVIANTKPVNGYVLTSYNLKIEENCKERIPLKDLENFYRITMSEGVQCLKNLSQGPEGQKNIKCFETLFADKENPPKLMCGGWPFGKDIYAVGSFPGSSKRHPYLWLSPDTSKLIKSNPKELKATIFHEMLHNCGYIHSEGIEVPYTCEECCFNNSLAADKKKNACNICAGKYQDDKDPQYVAELLGWSKDYPGWGRDMRTKVVYDAIDKKSNDNMAQILNETLLTISQKKELTEILFSNDKKLIKEKLKIFLGDKSAAIKNDRVIMIIQKQFGL